MIPRMFSKWILRTMSPAEEALLYFADAAAAAHGST
jgi:hypothetical protein